MFGHLCSGACVRRTAQLYRHPGVQVLCKDACVKLTKHPLCYRPVVLSPRTKNGRCFYDSVQLFDQIKIRDPVVEIICEVLTVCAGNLDEWRQSDTRFTKRNSWQRNTPRSPARNRSLRPFGAMSSSNFVE